MDILFSIQNHSIFVHPLQQSKHFKSLYPFTQILFKSMRFIFKKKKIKLAINLNLTHMQSRAYLLLKSKNLKKKTLKSLGRRCFVCPCFNLHNLTRIIFPLLSWNQKCKICLQLLLNMHIAQYF